ncbi:TetR/AcrR family transcriptional regulator [Mycetocola zhadangensis]|uniref:TetR/AcrR family transcriptional regulator n=1 Tax=Mycetocola zhadangensis TaxID=1164595 RepID=UPI003A4D58BD
MTSPLQQRRRRDAEREITEAALTLFEERGVQATTVEDIANAADISVRTVFRYFGRKEDTALVAHAEMRRALRDAVTAAGLERDPLLRIERAYVGVLQEFDEAGSFVLTALERVDRLKHSEPMLLQAGLRVDAEQCAWLAEQLTENAMLEPLQAALLAETMSLLFRQALQYWADHHHSPDGGPTLVESFTAVGMEFSRLGSVLSETFR